MEESEEVFVLEPSAVYKHEYQPEEEEAPPIAEGEVETNVREDVVAVDLRDRKDHAVVGALKGGVAAAEESHEVSQMRARTFDFC